MVGKHPTPAPCGGGQGRPLPRGSCGLAPALRREPLASCSHRLGLDADSVGDPNEVVADTLQQLGRLGDALGALRKAQFLGHR